MHPGTVATGRTGESPPDTSVTRWEAPSGRMEHDRIRKYICWVTGMTATPNLTPKHGMRHLRAETHTLCDKATSDPTKLLLAGDSPAKSSSNMTLFQIPHMLCLASWSSLGSPALSSCYPYYTLADKDEVEWQGQELAGSVCGS